MYIYGVLRNEILIAVVITRNKTPITTSTRIWNVYPYIFYILLPIFRSVHA